ncbi:phospholipase A1-Igamma1, chloroplastic [Cornus florida]|uniref:phospholipase A1-Igamma1, chloroplastic n=1 Tax=Cornus florida TaxID=4283 RepID=UPI00289EC920|nr:phospholipase A1-Igamma1, chloroplastic [Cornus florida]
MAAMKAVSSTIHHHHHHHHDAGKNRLPKICAFQEIAIDTLPHPKTSNRVTRLAESFSNLLHLHIETQAQKNLHISNLNNFLLEEKQNTPTMSPKEDISDKWRDIHGSFDWDNLLDPLNPWLRREIVKYGEFAQATYDAFDFDSFSEYCGSCRYNRHKLFDKLGLNKHGYNVSKYIYAMSQINMPRWLERSHLVDTWSKDSNWMGYVAVSDDKESHRIGRRDIVVAWRGTVAPSEWYEDMQRKLEPIGHGEAKVEHGFLSIYTSKSDTTRYNKFSASEQVMKEVTRLVNLYQERGEEVSLTITGHSLGGALALLNAYEAAASIPNLPINVISYGAPRVGNIAFRDEIHQMGVKTLRVVVKQDIVPKMPGLVLNESLQKFDDITGNLEWVYTHVGAELKLDIRSSPFLKRGFNLLGFHSLETYLHLIDGYLSGSSTFRSEARRDVALVNKACDMLLDELRIPQCWYQLAHKGLECNAHGRWVKPKRDPEDIPSPTNVHPLEMQETFVGIEPLCCV